MMSWVPANAELDVFQEKLTGTRSGYYYFTSQCVSAAANYCRSKTSFTSPVEIPRVCRHTIARN